MAKIKSDQAACLRRCLRRKILRPWAGLARKKLAWQRLGEGILTVALGLLLLSFPSVAQAHSSGPPRLSNADAGPYRVFVWLQPEPLRAGDTHISMLVTLAATGQPVTNGQVIVHFAPINQPAKALSIVTKLQDFLGTLYYEADISLPSSGEWRATLEINGPAGRGSIQFDSTVLPARTFNWGWTVGAVVVLVLLLGLIGVRSRWRAQHPATQARVAR